MRKADTLLDQIPIFQCSQKWLCMDNLEVFKENLFILTFRYIFCSKHTQKTANFYLLLKLLNPKRPYLEEEACASCFLNSAILSP